MAGKIGLYMDMMAERLRDEEERIFSRKRIVKWASITIMFFMPVMGALLIAGGHPWLGVAFMLIALIEGLSKWRRR